jgi:hypothetical protein
MGDVSLHSGARERTHERAGDLRSGAVFSLRWTLEIVKSEEKEGEHRRGSSVPPGSRAAPVQT